MPVKLELSQLPSNQIRGQLMNFVHLGPVNFETLVFHTGSGELHKLGFYFNEHIMSVVVLNAMFNNSSGGDRAQLNQVNIETVFNIVIRLVVIGRLPTGTRTESFQHARESESGNFWPCTEPGEDYLKYFLLNEYLLNILRLLISFRRCT